VFADTSFIIATIDPNDPWRPHLRNLSFPQIPVVTSEFVLIEVLNFLGSGNLRQAAWREAEA
jgi:hypothetical protein